MRAERLEKQRAQEEAAAAAAAAAEAEAGTTAAAKAEAQQEEGMDVDVDVHGCGVSAPMVVEEGDGGAVAAGAAAGATGDGVGMASAAPAAATVDAPKPEPGPAEEARARYEGALAAAMQGPELQGDDEEEQQQAKIPPADLSLVRPLEVRTCVSSFVLLGVCSGFGCGWSMIDTCGPQPTPTYTINTQNQSLRDYHSPEEARLRAVYRDLWERGLTVGCGSPYGADFTAYEGKGGRVL